MDKSVLIVVLVALFFVFSLPGCSSFRFYYPFNDLKTILNERIEPEIATQITIPFEANVEMKAFALRATLTSQTTKSKCRHLVNSILSKSKLNVKYKKHLTKTAIELFYEGNGNCLAYTNLFVALARSIGIRAVFADASLLINDIEENKGMIVNSGHICAIVFDEPRLLFIDFTDKIQRNIIGYQFIDDIEAIAHFYNNLGYEKRMDAQSSMDKEENRAGIEDFALAVKIDPDFYRAYNNLGVAYQQLGQIEQAIAYYMKTIEVNPDAASAYNNLGMLYYKNKEYAIARKYLVKAFNFNKSNYFIPYYLGLIAMHRNNYSQAQKYFEKAIRIENTFFPAYISLSQLFQKTGKTDKAEEMLLKAREIKLENQ